MPAKIMRDRIGGNGVRHPMAEALEGRRLLSVNVLQWHNDAAQTGLNAAETLLTPTNVKQNFGKLFSYTVDGQVYAQPLYVSGLQIDGAIHNVVFVATEHNSLYAFDANSNAGPGGGLLWHVNLGPSAATPNSYFGNRYGPYHDVNPEVGITSTPVINLATGTMYVDAFTNDSVGVYSHHIHAINIATGADEMTPALVAASVPGNGAGSVGGNIAFQAKQQIQRTALTLVNGNLYVAFAGYADTDPYHGWVLDFNASTLTLTHAFNSTPNLVSTPASAHAGEAGFWQSGAGLAYDGTGLYVISGNGDFKSSIGDYGDTALKLSTTLGVLDSFTPFNQATLSAKDTDFGSGGPVLLPDSVGSTAHPHLMLATGKQGLIYLIDRDKMGGNGTTSDAVVQSVSLGKGTWSSPAYYNGEVYFHGNGDVLKAFTIKNGVLSTAPVSKSATTFGFPGATPSVSSNGNTNGIVWEVQYSSTQAVLHALDATNLTTDLYNSGTATADHLGAGVKYAVPTIANGEVFVGTNNTLAVFGLHAATAPPAVSSLAATPGDGKVTLAWSASAGATSYTVKRATVSGGPYQTIATGVMGTPYTDSGLTDGTTYYYVVDAVNAAGPSPDSVQAFARPVFVAHINFNSDATEHPAGYVTDTGLVYGLRSNGMTFGWNADNTANARDRDASNSPDELHDGLIHLQKPSDPNAFWHIALPNGTYSVHILSGDAGFTDSVFATNANGQLALSGTPTAANHWVQNTINVVVTNGQLTITNASGAQNNKINEIDISML